MGKKRKTLASGAIQEHDSPFVERFRVVGFSISIGNWVFHAHLFWFFLRVIWYSVMK
ncbi:CPDc [Musa troglodytarum]|uniref:CPDc n=1 Tax=Musa troglodytarum TaxID=320322 RepID=A0A9E7HC01_9LILI|nr:CPDc [Musa troglodytarum]